MKKTLVGLLFSVMMMIGVAFAEVTPKDVQIAIKAHDYAKAEALAHEAVSAHSSSAKAHYLYAETLAFNGKHSQARAELLTAKGIDPSLKFASSPSFFNNLLSKEESLMAPAPQVTRFDSQAGNQSSMSFNLGAQPPVAHQQDEESSGALGFIIGLALLLAVAGGGVWFFKRRAEKAREREEQRSVELKAQSQLSDLVSMSKQLKDAELECKVAAYETATKDKILELIEAHQKKVLRAMESVKKRNLLSDYEVQRLLDDGATLCRTAETGQVFEPKAKVVAEPQEPQRESSVASRPSYEYGQHSPSRPNPSFGQSNTVHYAPPAQPVIVNQHDSGSDLLTGLVLGQMMSSHHDREVVREVRYVPEEPRRETYRAPEPVFDIGSGSSESFTDSSSKRDEPVFDIGSGDSDKWDSGSSPEPTTPSSSGSSDDDNNW